MNFAARPRFFARAPARPAASRMERMPPDPDPSRRISRMECWTLHSAVLPEPPSRQVSVYLPESYTHDPERRFPVFYLHDGQNLFDPHTSYLPGRTWHAGETADRLAASNEMEPAILVGVANTGLRRMAEYTPSRDFRLGGGEGRLYERLLTDELKPFLDQTYRTRPEPASTGVGGSSLGGLISLHLGFSRPDVFGSIAVLSPSLWWDHRSILNVIARTVPRPTLRIWLDIGTAEGQQHVRDTEALDTLLRQRGWREDNDLQTLIVPGAVHDEDAWAARFDQVLRFLFPAASRP